MRSGVERGELGERGKVGKSRKQGESGGKGNCVIEYRNGVIMFKRFTEDLAEFHVFKSALRP